MNLLPSRPSPLVDWLMSPEPGSVWLGRGRDTAKPPRLREPAKQGQHPGEGFPQPFWLKQRYILEPKDVRDGKKLRNNPLIIIQVPAQNGGRKWGLREE